jgi:hypothetical protein
MIKCGLATLLEDHPVAYEFTPDNIPLHLTHVDSLQVNLSIEQLEAKLREVLARQKAFSIRAVRDEFYGPDKDIPVTILELTSDLIALHKIIMDTLEEEGAILKNPHFHREGFAPHVSIYDSRRVPAGEQIFIKDISIGVKIGEGNDAVHRIVATVPFLEV